MARPEGAVLVILSGAKNLRRDGGDTSLRSGRRERGGTSGSGV